MSTDYENLSDDDFLKAPLPEQGEAATSEDPVPEEPAETELEQEAPAAEAETAASEPEEQPNAEDAAEAPVEETLETADDAADSGDTATEAPKESSEAAESKASDSADEDWKAKYEAEKARFDAMVAPFKANGAKFTPQSPEELVTLAQQGLNYAQKMSALKPNLQIMRSLQNNGLLDQSKINFLIDLSQKKPEAIASLLKEAKIDPIDMNLDSANGYMPSNYQVSEQEMNFTAEVEDLANTEEGRKTLELLGGWDNASKAALRNQPHLLKHINEHRGNGIYDRVNSEITRRRALGQLSSNTPFWNAYVQVGAEMEQQGLLAPAPAEQPVAPTTAVPQQSTPQQSKAPLEVRPAKPAPAPANNAQARAASPVRAASKPMTPQRMTPESMLAMSDDEFMKLSEFGNR